MKQFITWLTLGAILFLCSCSETTYTAQAYKPANLTPTVQAALNTASPLITYSSEIGTFYNEDFSLSSQADLRAFYDRLDLYAEQKVRQNAKATLSAGQITQALAVALGPGVIDTSPDKQLAKNITQSY
jgi:hypothetical protein